MPETIHYDVGEDAGSWSGRAFLIHPEGDVAEVAAELWKRAQAGRGIAWGGTVRAPATHLQPLTAEYVYTLRLLADVPSDGAVVPHGAVRLAHDGSGSAQVVEVLGSGAPPF